MSEANHLVSMGQEEGYGYRDRNLNMFYVYAVSGLPSPHCLREGLSQSCAPPVGEWSRCHTRSPRGRNLSFQHRLHTIFDMEYC